MFIFKQLDYLVLKVFKLFFLNIFSVSSASLIKITSIHCQRSSEDNKTKNGFNSVQNSPEPPRTVQQEDSERSR